MKLTVWVSFHPRSGSISAPFLRLKTQSPQRISEELMLVTRRDIFNSAHISDDGIADLNVSG